MDHPTKTSGRRSLLPQKTSSFQPLAALKSSTHRGRSRHAENLENARPPGKAASCIRDPTPSAVSLSQLANSLDPDPGASEARKHVSKMKPPANIGRSVSTRSRRQDSVTQAPIQRVPSAKRRDTLATRSRIAAPQTLTDGSPLPEKREDEASVASVPFPTSKLPGIDTTTHRSGSIEQGPAQRKASVTRPNIAVSRHSRPNNHQLPSRKPSSDQARRISTEPAPEPAPKPPASKPSAASTKAQKPASTTPQPHPTPHKPSKAPTSSSLVPPSTTTKPASSSDDTTLCPTSLHLQTQLLQLHLLHRTSAAIHAQWESSAKAHFQREWQHLCHRRAELQCLEREHQVAINYAALVEWSQSTATAAAASRSADFAERVQILSRNLQEVSSLLEVESRYARVIGSFEKWVTVAQKIRGSRRCAGAKKGKVEAKAELEFIEGLGEGWRSEVAFLERKLMACSREVQKLEAPREREEGRTSTIARIVALLKSAVEGMLEELASVRAIERELLFREATWVKERTARIASDIGDGADVPDSLS